MNTFRITKGRSDGGWWYLWRDYKVIAVSPTWQGAVNHLIRMGWAE